MSKQIFETRFKPGSVDDPDVDPTQKAHFQTGGSLCKTSINEIGQNSKDSKSKSRNKSSLRIFISDEKTHAKPEEYAPYLGSAIPHIMSNSSGVLNPPDFDQPMKYMVVEDFNTTGLEGDPLLGYLEKPDPNVANNFYYFWRNYGRSGKTGQMLGRYGLGKTIYAVLSRINTFYGLTVRESDGRNMLMGQTILKTHNRHDDKRQPYGYKPYGMFGMYDDDTCFAKPIEDQQFIERFRTTFNISRKSESGLSVVVPFVSEGMNAESIAYSFIEQFFFLILKDEIELIVEQGDKNFVIDAETVLDIVDHIDVSAVEDFESSGFKSKEQMKKTLEFTKWVQGMSESEFISLPSIDLHYKPRWNKATFFNDEEAWNEIRKEFDAKQRMAFRVPLKYHPTGSNPELRWFCVFIERDTDIFRPESIFIRDGLFISGISSLDRGMARGMVLISDPSLSQMFGDAENPAHTDWNWELQDFKDRYNDPRLAIQFVKTSLKKIYEQLQKPLEGLQKDFLIDMFFIDSDKTSSKTNERKPETNDDGGEETDENEIPEINGKPSPVDVQRLFSGVRIYKNKRSSEIPDTITAELGYDLTKGNPTKNYDPADFDVSKSPIKIQSKGIRIKERQRNRIVFEVTNKNEFEINVIGFDENRDLYVNINPNE